MTRADVSPPRHGLPHRGENEELALLKPVIRKAARSVAYGWPGVIDAEDAEQEITLNLIESPGSLKKISEMEPDAQYRAIVGMGHQIASKERDDYSKFKGSYRYSLNEVKRVLELGVLIEETDEFHEFVFDLIEALTAMTKKCPQYVDAILYRYADGIIPKKGADKTKQVRALERLTTEMNKSNKRQFMTRDDGIGTRKVISSQTARFISMDDYSGEGEGGFARASYTGTFTEAMGRVQGGQLS